MDRIVRLFSLLILVLGCGAAATAQNEFRPEQIPEAGIEITAPNRLERLPMKLGAESAFHLAKFRPKDNADFVRAQYYWYCDVYSWSKKKAEGDEPDLPEGMDAETKEKIKRLLAESGIKTPRSFEEWLMDQDNITIKTKGKHKKGKKGKLDYTHWVWEIDNQFGPIGLSYCEAAVYDFGDREVAVVILMPLEKKGKPKSKWMKLIDAMIENGKAYVPEGDSEDSRKRDKFADEDWKKEELERAKKNIAGLQGWDYFTTPNYIVLYSWDFEKPQEQGKSKKEAEDLSDSLEKMRALYMEYFPLDETGTKAPMPDPKSVPDLKGPITGGGDDSTGGKPELPDGVQGGEGTERLGKKRYSVLRFCADYSQFMKYGSTRPGVVGWFSPASKELVVFLGGDKMIGQPGFTASVVYHEGWHQYADFYFDHPDTPDKTALHRWYDEGYAEFFGGHKWGAGGWKYYGCESRYAENKEMVRNDSFVPFKKIVRMPISEFYGANAMVCYAQAQSMVAFLLHGEKTKDWDPKWGSVLEMYRRAMLVKGKNSIATETAFLDWTDEDYAKLEGAWKAWVDSPKFPKGR